jgi:hypothetical protein
MATWLRPTRAYTISAVLLSLLHDYIRHCVPRHFTHTYYYLYSHARTNTIPIVPLIHHPPSYDVHARTQSSAHTASNYNKHARYDFVFFFFSSPYHCFFFVKLRT